MTPHRTEIVVVTEPPPLRHRHRPPDTRQAMARASAMLTAAILLVVGSGIALAGFSSAGARDYIPGIVLFAILGLAASGVAWLAAATLRREAAVIHREVEAVKEIATQIVKQVEENRPGGTEVIVVEQGHAGGGKTIIDEVTAAKPGPPKGGKTIVDEVIVVERAPPKDEETVRAEVVEQSLLLAEERALLAMERQRLAREQKQLSHLVAEERAIRSRLWGMFKRR